MSGFLGNMNIRIVTTVPATAPARHAFGTVCHVTSRVASHAADMAKVAIRILRVLSVISVSVVSTRQLGFSLQPMLHGAPLWAVFLLVDLVGLPGYLIM